MTLTFLTDFTFASKYTISVLVNNLTDENHYEKRGHHLPGYTIAGRYSITF